MKPDRYDMMHEDELRREIRELVKDRQAAHASECGHTITEIHEKIQSGMAAARLTPEYEQEGRELERGHTIHASEHGVVISQNEAALADRIVNMIHVKDESLTLKERIAILIAEHREQGADTKRLEGWLDRILTAVHSLRWPTFSSHEELLRIASEIEGERMAQRVIDAAMKKKQT